MKQFVYDAHLTPVFLLTFVTTFNVKKISTFPKMGNKVGGTSLIVLETHFVWVSTYTCQLEGNILVQAQFQILSKISVVIDIMVWFGGYILYIKKKVCFDPLRPEFFSSDRK